MARLGSMKLIVVAVAAGSIATAGAWMAASSARTPAQHAALAQPPSASPVTAPVEQGPLVDELLLDGSVTREASIAIPGPGSPEGAEKAVVTKLSLKVGETIRSGHLIAEVSGRPVIALPGAFPAYRSVKTGDDGPDVEQLQRALRSRYGTPVTRRFDARTEHDVRKLYAAVGRRPIVREEPPPTGGTAAEPAPLAGAAASSPPVAPAGATSLVIPLGEIAFVPHLPATVTAVHAKVGGDGSGPLVTVASGPWQVTVKVDPVTEQELETLPEGARVSLAEGPFAGKSARLVGVRDAADDVDGDDGGPRAREAVFTVSDVKNVSPAIHEAQRITIQKAKSNDDAVIVPVAALWTGLDGQVQVEVIGSSGHRRIAVDVVLTSGGRAAVVPLSDRLVPGEEVSLTTAEGPSYERPVD